MRATFARPPVTRLTFPAVRFAAFAPTRFAFAFRLVAGLAAARRGDGLAFRDVPGVAARFEPADFAAVFTAALARCGAGRVRWAPLLRATDRARPAPPARADVLAGAAATAGTPRS